MIIMKKWKLSLISLSLTLALLLTAFAGLAVTASAENEESSPLNEHGLVDKVEGGSILHCWCWSFNSIKQNMKRISESGYSAIQTSPINGIIEGDDGGMEIYGDGKWYFAYQPTNYNIGNYMLGTEEEFKAMCTEAHNYGVKVIVDVVANHTTPSKNLVASELRNIAGGLYHSDSGNSDDARRNMTQWYNGLPDVKTQNPNYQQVILNFLKKAVADGADGFRYDTAKHIELPDDDPSYASEFWPTVLANGSTFQYGEALQGVNTEEKKATRLADYSKIMHVTASAYGNSIRDYFLTNSGTASTLKGYNSEGAASDRLVMWVESHDTYANGETPNNVVSSYWLTNQQIRIGWAMIAARSDTTTLFFSRPYGSSPSTDRKRDGSTIWGTNHLGDAGDDNYFHPEVVAVNKFRNAMIGESETLANVGSKKNFMVTRGTRGAVITNNADTDLVINNRAVTLAQGTYTDAAHGGKFYVVDGKLSGTIKAGEIAVLYDDPDLYTTEVPTTEPTTAAPTVEPTTAAPTTEPVTEPVTEPAPATTMTLKAAKSTIAYGASTTVTATVKNSTEKTVFTSSNKKIATVSSTGKVVAKGVGTVTIKASNNGVTKSVNIKVVKASNPMKVTFKKSVTANSKKNTTIKGVVTVKKAQGKVTYKTNNKKVTCSAGKLVVKKGLKKGKTVTVKITVTAKGNANYNKAAKTVAVKIKVK